MECNPSQCIVNLRRWLEMMAIARAAARPDAVAHCEREVLAMERELLFRRYGRTDVL
jgi:DNA-binding GntR family transcriptional regulator